MAKIKIEIEVSKETYELGQGLVAMLTAVMVAKKDGWQMGTDIPAVAMAAFGQMAAIEGIDLIDEEIKEDPSAFGKSLMCALADGYGAVKAEEE
jgi:hypothetical protein